MDLLMMDALNAERAVELQQAERRRLRSLPAPSLWRLLRRLAPKAVSGTPAPPPAKLSLPERGGIVMMTCALCKFATPLDDVVLAGPAGRCVCLRCYTRETGTTRRMSNALEQRLRGVLEHV